MPSPDFLERRFGRYAIRGLIGYIALFQCVAFAIMYVNPGYVELLKLRPFVSMDGEWWRLVSFIFVPGATNPLMFIFSIMILVLCMQFLESELGVVRVNLLVGLFFVCQWTMAAFLNTEAGFAIMAVTRGSLEPGSAYFATNLFFIVAMLFPKMVFNLFGIVPLQAWVLALVDVGMILSRVLRQPELWLTTIVSLLPCICVGLPLYFKGIHRRTTAAGRRARFKANSLPVADSFHQCAVCGRTDASNPELDFRVMEDGGEYCVDHLPR